MEQKKELGDGLGEKKFVEKKPTDPPKIPDITIDEEQNQR